MGILEDLLAGNERYVRESWDPSEATQPAIPTRRLAVVACMDTRYAVERVLGLEHGDAKVIRNAGNLLDDGALRSLLVAVHLLKVEKVAVMGHTKCGMIRLGRGEFDLAHSINERTDVSLHEAMRPDFQRWLGGFSDPEDNIHRSMDLILQHPYMPPGLEVVGLIYDNETGRVRPVGDVRVKA